MPTHPTRDALAAEKVRLEAEIAALEAKQAELGSALGEFAHEARRVGESLERDRSPGLEARRRALAENRRLTETDIAETADALAALHRRLAEVVAALERRGCE